MSTKTNGNAQEVHVEEENLHEEGTGKTWTEEFTVAGNELVDFVKKLVTEATVRRIVIKNEARDIHFEIPLMLGLAGIALLPVYAALGLIAALVADFTILVERSEKAPEAPAAEDVDVAEA